MPKKISRKDFIKLGLTTAAGLSLTSCSVPTDGEEIEEGEPDKILPEESKGADYESSPIDKGEKNMEGKAGMPLRRLGKTGLKVSLLGLGGSFAVSRSSAAEAGEIIKEAINKGVNYIDTAPTYGRSEYNIGQAIKGRRQDVYLASKTIDRSYDGTMRLFEKSLSRLNTDYLDLYQLHGLKSSEEVDRVLAKDGAARALAKLKRQGLVKYTGVTGHKEPLVLLKSIREYDFDCILMSLNAADRFYQPLQGELLEEAVNKEMGIIAMKAAAYGKIFKDNGITTMEQALSYVFSYPVATAIVGINSLDELKENLKIVKRFKPLKKQEKEHLENLVKPYQAEVNFFKTRW